MVVEKEQKNNKSLEELVLNTDFDRYKLIPVAARWIEELKYKEEYKGFSIAELIEVALKEILTAKVSIEKIEKLPPKEAKKKIYETKIRK